jgi:CDP-diacylglycerol---glycerol-3-phosphate 3-phosphatidyltransferase
MAPAGAERLVVLANLAAGLLSLGAFALVRPPSPPRLAGRRGLVAAVGRWAYWAVRPLVGLSVRLRLSPATLTWLGLALTVVAAGFAALGWWGLAGVMLLWGGTCDMLDGELARATGRVSRAGAFLDSNLDRLSEIVLFAGLGLGLSGRAGPLLAGAALAASLMVSYARARGEGLKVDCPPFGLERPHRVGLTLVPLLLAPFLESALAEQVLLAACAVVAAGAAVTAGARIAVIHGILRRDGGE